MVVTWRETVAIQNPAYRLTDKIQERRYSLFVREMPLPRKGGGIARLWRPAKAPVAPQRHRRKSSTE
jgi:hypothetical protein